MHDTEDKKAIALEIVPHVGLGAIRLGDSATAVRQTLVDYGVKVGDQYDPYCWEQDQPWCSLTFVKEPTPRLVQILCQSKDTLLHGQQLVDLQLDEALLALGVQSFDDTVWTATCPELDFSSGHPVAEQPTACSNIELLCYGTLWIKSLGLGLELHKARVDSVSLRLPKYLPQVGCGPVTEQQLLEASDPIALESQFKDLLPEPLPTKSVSSWRQPLWLITAITTSLLCWTVYTMVSEFRSWMNATSVTGRVVAMSPEGPFPDVVTFEYRLPNDQTGSADVPTQYTSARKLGQEVELVYREDEPRIAMTRLQSRDFALTVSLSWLSYLIPLLGLEIYLLFPNLSRRRR